MENALVLFGGPVRGRNSVLSHQDPVYGTLKVVINTARRWSRSDNQIKVAPSQNSAADTACPDTGSGTWGDPVYRVRTKS